MKKNIIKVLCSVLICMILSVNASVPVKANDYSNEIKILLANGYNKNDISTLNELLKIGLTLDNLITMGKETFELHRGKHFKSVVQDTKYFKVKYDKDQGKEKFIEVTEEEYKNKEKEIKEKKEDKNRPNSIKSSNPSNGIVTLGIHTDDWETVSISEGWMKLRTIAADAGKNSWGAQVAYLQTDFTWLKTPYYTTIDAVGMSWNQGFSISPGTSRVAYFATSTSPWGGTNKVSYTSSSLNNDSGFANGIGFEIDLFTNDHASNITYKDHYGHVSTYVEVSPTYFTGLINVFGHYEHQEEVYGISPSINIPVNGGSLGLSATTTFDRATSTLLGVRVY